MNINPAKTKVIFGPPGTGKTYRLMGLMEEAIAGGMNPKDICFVTFTRKASNEAKQRALKQFKLQEVDIPYFRTLHSLAFHVLALNKEDIMQYVNFVDVVRQLGLTISGQSFEDNGEFTVVHTKGDRMFFLENLARATARSYKDILAEFPDDDIGVEELENLGSVLLQYKQARGKMDFTDMITKFNSQPVKLKFRLMFVDEAQDLSPIQWKMVMSLADCSDRLYIAGDDDQAIFKWAGADISTFQNLGVETEILKQSFRVPENILLFAKKILKKIRVRRVKDYVSTGVPGTVARMDNLDQIDMSKGTWLLLARNIYYLQFYAHYCMQQGYLFDSRHNPACRIEAIEAIKNWERLRRGELITAKEAKNVYEFIPVKIGVRYGFKVKLELVDDNSMIDIETLMKAYGLITQEIWHKALGKLTSNEVQYIITVVKNGENMMKEPRIRIATIHSVKGGEADNVVLNTDLARRTYEEMMKHPDDELRVWYVGITRAKSALFVLNPQTQYYIEI